MSAKIVAPKRDKDYIPVTALLDEQIPVDSFITNFDPTNKDHAKYIALANLPATLKVDAMLGQPLDIMGWICVKFKLPDENGKPGDVVVKTTLVLRSGGTLSAMATGLTKSIEVIRQTMPDVPYNPPLVMRLMKVDVDQAGPMLILAPWEETEPAKPKK